MNQEKKRTWGSIFTDKAGKQRRVEVKARDLEEAIDLLEKHRKVDENKSLPIEAVTGDDSEE